MTSEKEVQQYTVEPLFFVKIKSVLESIVVQIVKKMCEGKKFNLIFRSRIQQNTISFEYLTFSESA